MTPERWAQIQEVFEAALERKAVDREAYLASACVDDVDLRREVESLIAASERDGPVDALASQIVAPLIEKQSATFAGRLVGPYRIISEIGHGGMGTVCLAERADGQFEQQVALKLLRAGVRSESLHRRFLQERRILARLQHPNIARLYDGGFTESTTDPGGTGRPFFAMEYVDGTPIDRYCDEKRMGVAQRLRLFTTVCKAVQYAHQNLVVHRDLKPSNIFVTKDGRVKLLDFGIAKLLEDQAEADPAVTRTGMRLLTTEYASPEQIRGDPVTTASDVYTLGVVLYELLTGRRPHQVRNLSPGEVERVVCEEAPARPSTAVTSIQEVPDSDGATRTIRPDAVSAARSTTSDRLQRRLIGDLDMIVLKALAKEPERRYASAEHLAQDINRHLAGRPVEAQGDTVWYRARKFARRHRWGLAVAAGFLGVLAVGSVALLIQQQATARERDRAQREALKAREVSAFLVDMFENADPIEAQGDTLTIFDLLDDGSERVRSDLAGQPDVQSAMLLVLGRAYRNMAQFERAAPLIDESLRLRQTSAASRVEVAESLIGLGRLEYDQGRYDTADSLLGEALRLLEATSETAGETTTLEVSEKTADVLDQLAASHHARGNLDEAERYYLQAIDVRTRSLGPRDATVGVTLSSLGSLMRHQGRFVEADSVFQIALDVLIEANGRNHLTVANTYNNLGVLTYSLGDYDGSRRYLEEALEVRRQVLGDVHPEVAQSLNNLAAVIERQGDLDAAEPLYREALDLKRGLLGNEHPAVARSLNNLALLLRSKGDLKEAEALFRESLEIRRNTLGPGHADVGRALYNLGALYEDLGDYAAAESHYRDALAVRREALGERHPDVAITLAGLGAMLHERGRSEIAEPHLRAALDIWLEAFPEGHELIPQAQGALGDCLASLRRFEEAEPLLLASYETSRGLAEGTGHDGPVAEARQRLVDLYEAWGKPEIAESYWTLVN